jgi:hypothetical protein
MSCAVISRSNVWIDTIYWVTDEVQNGLMPYITRPLDFAPLIPEGR